MTESTLIIVLVLIVCGLALLSCAGFAYLAFSSQRKLMWFHNAGQGMAAHELRKAEIDLQHKQAAVDKTRAEAERLHAEAALAQAGGNAKTPTGGAPQVIRGVA